MEKHLKQEKQFRKVHSELCALKSQVQQCCFSAVFTTENIKQRHEDFNEAPLLFSQLRSPQPVLAACPHREVRLQGGLPLHSKP